MSTRSSIFDKLTDTTKLCVTLFILELFIYALTIFDWSYGILRGVIIIILLLFLILSRSFEHSSNYYIKTISTRLNVVALLAGLSTIALSAYAIDKTLQTGKIELDQGETAWRSARLLAIGRNPYGYGEIVDYYVYAHNLDNLSKNGLGPEVNKAKLLDSLIEYDRTLDPTLRHRLLPIETKIGSTRPLEVNILGYKYGPLAPIILFPFVHLGISAIVPTLNNIACIGMFITLFFIMYNSTNNLQCSLIGLIVLFMDPAIRMYYILLTANDVWPLLFCSICVYFYYKGKMNLCAIFLAIAFCFKIIPSVLFVPLLLKSRSPLPVSLFLGVVAIIYGPMFFWDPIGIFYNVLLWPILIPKDNSSWIFYVPPYLSLIATSLAFAGIITLWFRFLAGHETRLFWTLAVVNLLVILVAPVFHTNYLPWTSIWIVAALVEGTPIRTRASVLGSALSA